MASPTALRQAAEVVSSRTHQFQPVGVNRTIFCEAALRTGWDRSHGMPRRLHTSARTRGGWRPATPRGLVGVGYPDGSSRSIP